MTNRHHIYLFAGSLLTLAALNSLPNAVQAADTLPPAIKQTVGTSTATTQTEDTSTSTDAATTTLGHVLVIYREVGTRSVLAREYLSGAIGTAVQFDTSFYTQPYQRLGYTVTGNGTVNGSAYTASTQEYTVLLTPPTTSNSDASTTTQSGTETTPTTNPSVTASTTTPASAQGLFAHRSMPSVGAMVPAATAPTTRQPAAVSTPQPAAPQSTTTPAARTQSTAPAKANASTHAPQHQAATQHTSTKTATNHGHKTKRHTKDEQQQYPADTSSPIAPPAPTPGGGGGNGNAAPTGLAAYFVSLSGKIVFGISA